MEVTVLTGFAGYPAYQPGEVVDLAPAVAKAWIAEGLAKRDETAGHSNDEALTALHDQSTRERAKLARRRADVERQKSDLLTAVARTRNLDLEYRDPDDPDRLAYEHARLERLREVAPLDAKLREIDAALDELPRRHEQERARIAAETVVGGLIDVPDIPAALLNAADPQLDTLEAKRAALLAEQQRAADDRRVLEEANRDHSTYVALVGTRLRAGIASAKDLKDAELSARHSGEALGRLEARCVEIDRRLAEIDSAAAERRMALQRARAERIDQALRQAYSQAAEKLRGAMEAFTFCHRLRNLTDEDWPSFPALDADRPRAAGREVLQQLAERGIGSHS